MSIKQLSAADWPVVSTLLDQLLTLPPDERESFMQSLDGERARYRDTLRMLLAREGGVETDEFLATLPKLTRALGADPLLAQAGPAAGDRVGPYQLLGELGTGGMGAVWLAERVDGALKRTVALKLPRIAWDPNVARRVARERDILAGLEHPHIARLYDAGVDAQGRPYLAMEYVEGLPIDVYCRNHKLPLTARVGLLLQVAQAVAYAHRRLIVHRDLKPSNILVTADGQVRLLDFGIARLLAADGATAEGTQAAPALTPGYASPEQWLGQPLSTATDIYSLGVAAHELLAGERPFERVAEPGLLRGQAAATRDPGRPSALLAAATSEAAEERGLSPAAWRRQVAGDLDAVLLRALARRPEDRYPSIEALADDLQRWCEGRPVTARRASRGYLLRKFVRRHRVAVAAASLATVALATTAAVAVTFALQAREEAQRAKASRDFLMGLFERADPDLRGGRDATARELLEIAEVEATRLPTTQRREVLQTIATLWVHFNAAEQAAAAQARVTADLASSNSSADHEALTQSRLEEARIAMLAGKLDDSERFFAAALNGRAMVEGTFALRAQAAEQSGWLHLYRNQSAEAVARFVEAETLATRARDTDRRVLSMYGLAHAQQLAGHRRDALQTLQRLKTIAATESISGRGRAVLLTALSTSFYNLGRYVDGWPSMTELLDYAETLGGSDAVSQLRLRVPWLRYTLRLGYEREALAWLNAHPLDAVRAKSVYGAELLIDFYLLNARVAAAMANRDASLAAFEKARAVIGELDAAAQANWRALLAYEQALAALAMDEPTTAAAALAEAENTVSAAESRFSARILMAAAVTDARRSRWGGVSSRLEQARQELERDDGISDPDAALATIGIELARLSEQIPQHSTQATTEALTHAAAALVQSFGEMHPNARAATALARTAAAAANLPLSEFQHRLREAAGPLAQQLLI